MTIDIRAPDGALVRFPDGTADTTIRAVMARAYPAPRPEMGWGEYLRGLGREAVQGATFDFGDELGLTDSAASRDFSARHPIASTLARVGGSLPLFLAGPGAAAARWAMGARSLPRNIVRSAGLGAGLGGVAGAGAGEGGLEGRLSSAGTGAAFGGILGGAIPPVAAGVGAAVNRVRPLAEHLTRRRPSEQPLPFSARSDPIEGARFVADGTPPAAGIADAQERALLSLRDAMLRGGTTPDELRTLYESALAAAKPHSSGQAQTVTALADLNEALTRQAGVYARQSPEAAREMTRTMQARQTGITPMGANETALGRRGIPNLPRLSDPITGREARARFGTDFGAGQDNIVPMGQRGRIRDWLERLYLIKDKKHHGFGRTGIETMEQAAKRADDLSLANYGAAYKTHAMTNFRTQIDDVFKRYLDDAAVKESPTVERAIANVQVLFRPGKPVNLEQFDRIKRELDGKIRGWLNDPKTVHQGGLINDLKNSLMKAVDDATGGDRSLYAKARNEHAKEMGNMRAYLLGRHAHTDDEALRRTGPLNELTGGEEVTVRHFNALNDEQRKLFSQGYVDNLVARMPRDASRSGLRIFDDPRILNMIRETVPAESRNRAQMLGRYIDFEGRMPETKQVAVGGSPTARNVQDDLMSLATEASHNVQGIMGVLRGNQSLYQLGERLITLAWDRAFGVGADAAREGARMLFTANPAEIEAILQQVAARMPASRMAHFNNLMAEAQRYLSASAAIAGGGMAGTPVPPASAFI